MIGVLAGGTGQASATTITFDEIAATNNDAALTTALSYLGVTFGGDNAGIWGGNSNGNPGNWGLEGTNGPQFLGFNGSGSAGGYSDSVTFASPVTHVSFDTSRSNGSVDGTITLDAYDSATFLGSDSAIVGSINTWSTLSFSGAGITNIVIVGTGTGFHPFGVDNLTFSGGVPEPSTWAMMMLGFAGLCFVGYRKAKGAALPAA